ncbi:E3 ubiquitin-protein ligase Mdm2 [Dissostichus eleginoides]|uniref:E3 ubiquitin-protein ligase Mdm2 n=1 Tax=Dissostichus eleginoides TaxID=100907 RepID=A0AAD9FKZ0_DISEL|nr:E3 ubiquitin-protein ligase Mdm2 [Dissostichus eleginoides]
MSAESQLNVDTADDNKLVKPKLEFQTLLQHAGATKDTFTMKEVMFYLGQYIIQKQLYDQKQQHIVHCSQDALGRVLGVDSFSVKEPRVLFAMITKNLVAIKSQDSPPSPIEPQSETQTDKGAEDPHTAQRVPVVVCDWRIGEGQTQQPIVRLTQHHSDSDNFSVEFEVESVDSDDYNEDEASLMSADDQVYEVTIFEAEDNDSFDEDTEITEADYWRCVKCDELNPPLPGKCLRCWTLRQDWLSEASLPSKPASSSPKDLPTKPTDQSAARETPGSDGEENEGVDVPDGKRSKETPLLSQCFSDSSAPNSEELLSSSQPSSSSQQNTPDSQPSSSSIDSQELLPSSPNTPSTPRPPAGVPELERSVSAEWRLPDSCLDPCLICQSRPKNGCIVHGRTGHLMSCYVCARKLKKRNKLCPVCRLPIQSVVFTYIS